MEFFPLILSATIGMLLELSEGGEQIPAWKREFEERQRDEAFGNALLNKIRQSRGNRYPYFVQIL